MTRSPYRFKLADEREVHQALALRDRVYEDDAGHVPSDDLDPRGFQLIAVHDEGLVVASARVLGPECRPYEFERHVEMDRILGEGSRIGLVGRFCVAREYRCLPHSIWLHLGMLKLMYLVAKSQHIDNLVMYTFAHLLVFYRGAYFVPLNETFFHPGYNCDMHLMNLNVSEFEREHLGEASRLRRSFASIDANADA